MDADRLKERDLLFALARTPLTAAATHWIQSNLAGEVDWTGLVDRGGQWQVEPVVFYNLRTSFAGLMPADVLERVTQREREARARTLARGLIIIQLLDRIEAAGIPVMLIKGPALGATAYGDASLRSFGDADVLVRRRDVERARDFLLANGFVRDLDTAQEAPLIRDGHALEFSSSNLKVELHWTLFPLYMRLDFDADDLWASSRTVSIAGGAVRVLSRANDFLFLCGHGAKHEWMSARWIVDVAQACERLDQTDVDHTVALADRLRARRLLALGLLVARDCCGADISRFPLPRQWPDATVRRLGKMVKSQIAGLAIDVPEWLRISRRIDPNLGPLLFWARCRERLNDRVACIGRVAFVPTDRDGEPGALRWAKRPTRLVRKSIRRLI